MTIRRDRYLQRIIARKHNGLVKVITGIRRCGKSYLLFNLFRRHLEAEGVDGGHIIGVDLEDKEYALLRNPNRLFDYIMERIPCDGKWTYVFIDEIQMCRKVLMDGVRRKDVLPEDVADSYITFYDILNSLRKKPNVDVYVTGSNSKLLSKDVATNFRDRGVEIKLHPLSFAEYFEFSDLSDKSEALSNYMIWGGMPMAVMDSDDASRAEYLKSLFGKVYLKDIVERNRLKSVELCELVLNALCSSVGSLTNPNKLCKTLGSEAHIATTTRTLAKHLDYFTDAFLFEKAERYDVRGKKHLAFPRKYYAEDVGLRNARLNFRENDEAHLMENVLFNELVSRGYSVDVGVVDVLDRNRSGKVVRKRYEIDFVVNAGFNKVYVQSAYSLESKGKVGQERNPLIKSGDFFSKIIVEWGYGLLRPDGDGIFHVGIIPFLLDESILSGIIAEAKFSPRKMAALSGSHSSLTP
ncbi:MAG: ATP-binding protein [Kiritimatiellae bacterium]|nr:ATP-binding protein [Kiritimatiellia bacterium]